MPDATRSLSPAAQKFILHWGEMGTRWGINRTVAQVHALLYLAPRPMAAEEIARTLSVARSNVSTSLRELQGWRIVRGVSVFGDRRQHFECTKDLYEMFRVIMEEREGEHDQYRYRVLAASRLSEMGEGLEKAAADGFRALGIAGYDHGLAVVMEKRTGNLASK